MNLSRTPDTPKSGEVELQMAPGHKHKVTSLVTNTRLRAWSQTQGYELGHEKNKFMRLVTTQYVPCHKHTVMSLFTTEVYESGHKQRIIVKTITQGYDYESDH